MNNNYQFFYEAQIFNRNFLNCSQRQAFLHLDSNGYDIAQLFGYCLLDFDTIFLQMIAQPIARYDFVCDGLSTNKLHEIGINRIEYYFDEYKFAKEFIQKNINKTPCIQIECDVFNVPHRKEYQNKIHIQHFITILDYQSENDIWVVYDDLTNGDLRVFEFSEEYLCIQFNLSKNKSIRLFEYFNKEKITIDELKLNKSYNCLNQLINLNLSNHDILIKIKNFFLIYLGSRQCFLYYCRKKI